MDTVITPHLLPQLLLARGLNLLKFCLWVQRPHLLPQFLDLCPFIYSLGICRS